MPLSTAGKTPIMTQASLSRVPAPVARVGDRVVWQCPTCRHQFCGANEKPAPGSPLVAWLRAHSRGCSYTRLPMGEDAATERAALQSLVELDGEAQ